MGVVKYEVSLEMAWDGARTKPCPVCMRYELEGCAPPGMPVASLFPRSRRHLCQCH